MSSWCLAPPPPQIVEQQLADIDFRGQAKGHRDGCSDCADECIDCVIFSDLLCLPLECGLIDLECGALECGALRRVRDGMGLRNLKIMIPFCRTLDEGRRVLAEMKQHSLERGENGLEIYVMCEIPNNVILLDQFARHFDGFSIGSNDLTQLTLGVDRDSEIVAFDFDERDPGVKEMIRLAIEGCRRNGRHSGICGQAPSDHPEFAGFLVEHGIDTISLTADAVVETTRTVVAAEKRLAGSREA